MPASIVVVLDEADFAERVSRLLASVGHDAIALPNSMAALAALQNARQIELLVTCADFGPGQPNGVALARMAKSKRPGIKVLFVGEDNLQPFVEGLGTLMVSPVTSEQVAAAVTDLLTPEPPRAA